MHLAHLAAIGSLLLSLSGCASVALPTEPKVGSATIQTVDQPSVSRPQTSSPRRMLFIGNSYFYYNDSLHNHVKRMVDAAGLVEEADLEYKSATIGGAALFDHNIDHLLDPESLRVQGPYEVVVMQGGSAAPLSKDRRERFARTAEIYAAKVRVSGGEPVLYMTHAYVTPHPRAQPNMIRDIASLYVSTGNQIDALVIPVGLAFEEAYRRRPDIQLHQSFDGSHPSLLGTYLAAATVLASLYETSPIGNSYTYFGRIADEDAHFLQVVAHDTVQEFYGRKD